MLRPQRSSHPHRPTRRTYRSTRAATRCSSGRLSPSPEGSTRSISFLCAQEEAAGWDRHEGDGLQQGWQLSRSSSGSSSSTAQQQQRQQQVAGSPAPRPPCHCEEGRDAPSRLRGAVHGVQIHHLHPAAGL